MVPYFPPRGGALAAASARPMGGNPLQTPNQMQLGRNVGMPGQQMAPRRFGMGGFLRSVIKKKQESEGTPWMRPSQGTPSAPAAQLMTRQRTPMMSPEDFLNYGMGAAHHFYQPVDVSTQAPSVATTAQPPMQAPGHVGIPADPGTMQRADLAIRGAREQLSKLGLGRRFEDGGKVEVKANKLKDIQSAISRLQSKQLAQALDAIRAEKSTMDGPRHPLSPLERMADGGEVMPPQQQQMAPEQPEQGLAENGDPSQLYAEYQQLIAALEDPNASEEEQMMIVERLQQLGSALEALGVQVPEGAT